MTGSITSEGIVNKKTIFRGVMWNCVEKYSSQGITFLVSIVMARLLSPKEYGVVGIISVFISISSVFINSGLGRALTRKLDCDTVDYCTANWVNIAVSVICYIILCCSSPFIADFYNMPILVPTIRVMGIGMLFGALSGVSRTILSKKLSFKRMSIVTLVTSILSGILGILLAYMGFGVWALVFQTVLSSMFSSMILMYAARFRPKFMFSKKSFKELFGFGSKLLGSDLIYMIFQNIYPLIIGKGFSSQDVGYFTRASSYATLIPTNSSGVLENVLFPVFSNMQNDTTKLHNLYNRALTLSSLLIFTGNFFLMGLASPLILIIISDKWMPCVPLLQILCIGSLFDHINSISGRLLLAKGHAGIFLKIATITRPIAIAVIVVSFFFGLTGLAWGHVLLTLLATVINSYYVAKMTGINPLKALKSTFHILLMAGPIGLTALILFKYILESNITNLLCVFGSMCIVMIGMMKIFTPSLIHEILNLRK